MPLELVVDFVRMPRTMRGFAPSNDEPVEPVPSRTLADVINTRPAGNIGVRDRGLHDPSASEMDHYGSPRCRGDIWEAHIIRL